MINAFSAASQQTPRFCNISKIVVNQKVQKLVKNSKRIENKKYSNSVFVY